MGRRTVLNSCGSRREDGIGSAGDGKHSTNRNAAVQHRLAEASSRVADARAPHGRFLDQLSRPFRI